MTSDRQKDGALLGKLFSARGQTLTRRQLAQAAKVPLNDLEQRLSPYIQAGYPIVFHPQGRVELQEPPDIWCAEEIIARCLPKYASSPVWDPVLLAKTSSTNDVVRKQAQKGVASGFLVAASSQTAGRGRLGRSWESPPERGLYLSILLRSDLLVTEAGRLTILSSVALVDAVEAISNVRPQIKWPNDLVMRKRKLAGLLIETERKKDRLAFAVIGIGLNVGHEAKDFSPEVRPHATSLFLATGQKYRRADLLVAFLQALELRLTRPFEEAREAWSASSLTLGQRVTLTTARGRKHGQAVGLDESGALLLRESSGKVEVVTAGDMQAC